MFRIFGYIFNDFIRTHMQETVKVAHTARNLQRPSFLLSVEQPQECGFWEGAGGGVSFLGVFWWGFFSGLIFFKENKSNMQNVNFIMFGQQDLRHSRTL